jgi:hypothetical protein
MMSLGTWTRRSTKYQRFLNLSNVFLLIVSTGLLFSSIVLMSFYHMTKLFFWSWYFYAVPMCMLALGLYTFAVSVYGFLISTKESRGLISLIAVFLSVAFLGQLFSVFAAIELRNTIGHEVIPFGEMTEYMEQYESDESVKAEWDAMQSQLRCCGGREYEIGYTDWGIALRNKYDVPDSCCHRVNEECGRGKISQGDQLSGRENLGIWKDGCVTILQQKMRDDIMPFLMVYAGLGVLLALVELITVVLACAYVAQIGRRMRRDQHAWERTGNARAEDEYLPALSKETNF